MGEKYVDFIVDYDPDPGVLGRRILNNMFLNRLKHKKPTVVMVAGDSGEAKSYNTLKMLEDFCKTWGISLSFFVKHAVIYTPHQYITKMDKILYDKKLKKVKAVMIDEAREVVDGKTWYEFTTRAIADINAMSRRIKPLVIFIVTQYIGDVAPAVRRTLTFYCKCIRPLGQKPRMFVYRIWKDESDIEHPRLKKRRVYGYVRKDGRRIRFKPSFRFNKPNKEAIELYEQLNFDNKTMIIKSKLAKVLKRLELDRGNFAKIDEMVKFYSENAELRALILAPARKGRKPKLKKDFYKMHDLSKVELDEFEKKFYEKLAEKGEVNNGVQEAP